MAKHRIICNWSVLGKSLHRIMIRAPNTVRVRESLQEELFQQFTMFHDGICHTCFDAQIAPSDEPCWGKSPPVYSQADKAGPSSATPSTGTPRNACTLFKTSRKRVSLTKLAVKSASVTQ